MAHMKVVAFQGNLKGNVPPSPPLSLAPVTNLDLTPSPDVPLAILKRKLMASDNIEVARGVLMELNQHLKVETGEDSLAVDSSSRLLGHSVSLFALRLGTSWLTSCTGWSRE